jgi:Mg2+/Co2+ transporter CorB
VTSIMTARDDVAWLDAKAQVPALLARLRTSAHREFPLGEGSLDRVLGIVRKEDVLAQCVDGGPIDMRRAARQALTVARGRVSARHAESFQARAGRDGVRSRRATALSRASSHAKICWRRSPATCPTRASQCRRQ